MPREQEYRARMEDRAEKYKFDENARRKLNYHARKRCGEHLGMSQVERWRSVHRDARKGSIVFLQKLCSVCRLCPVNPTIRVVPYHQ